MPADSLRSITEDQYWRDYDLISNDVHAAMVICYTHRAINHLAATDVTTSSKMNANLEFWQATSYSLQSMLMITLARVLDANGDVHSVHKLLSATIARPEFFSRSARRTRVLSVPGGTWTPEALAEYDRNNTWEPTSADLRTLKKDLAQYKAIFDNIYIGRSVIRSLTS